jgi:hypothetical protein
MHSNSKTITKQRFLDGFGKVQIEDDQNNLLPDKHLKSRPDTDGIQLHNKLTIVTPQRSVSNGIQGQSSVNPKVCSSTTIRTREISTKWKLPLKHSRRQFFKLAHNKTYLSGGKSQPLALNTSATNSSIHLSATGRL